MANNKRFDRFESICWISREATPYIDLTLFLIELF